MTTTDDPRSRSAPDEAADLPRPRPYVASPASQRSGPRPTPRFTPRPQPATDAARPARPTFTPARDEGRTPARGAERPRRRPAVHRAPAERAVIGDEIRIPIMWCEFGSCIARYTHRDALGERDLRARALAAGWRYDALGRLACPDCTQHDPAFWPTRPPVLVTGRWRRPG
jgi:hypothetical protein